MGKTVDETKDVTETPSVTVARLGNQLLMNSIMARDEVILRDTEAQRAQKVVQRHDCNDKTKRADVLYEPHLQIAVSNRATNLCAELVISIVTEPIRHKT